MKITVLGAGGAFASVNRGNSAFLVEHDNRAILIDCGSTVPYVLRDEMGFPLQQVTDIIVTHNHADHIGGIEQVLYSCKYMPASRGKPTIWANSRVSNGLQQALMPGMGWASDGSAIYIGEEYCDIVDVGGATVNCHGLPLDFFPMPHIGNMPCFAVGLGRLLVSGDTNSSIFETGWHTTLVPELIFHEAEFGFKTGVHCPVGDIQAPSDVLKKTWLYHCASSEGCPPGFAGILAKGLTFEL